jgi:hypothetical protein
MLFLIRKKQQQVGFVDDLIFPAFLATGNKMLIVILLLYVAFILSLK